MLYHPRLMMINAWVPTVGNALGIARGAIDAFIELASHKGSTSSTTLLRDRPAIQTRDHGSFFGGHSRLLVW